MLLIPLKKIKKLKKRKFQNVEDKFTHYLDLRKTKMIFGFNGVESASIKSFTVKKKIEIKVTTRFMSDKLLMFAKLTLKSFISILAETLYLPDATVREKYHIGRVIFCHILTDTGSTSLLFQLYLKLPVILKNLQLET